MKIEQNLQANKEMKKVSRKKSYIVIFLNIHAYLLLVPFKISQVKDDSYLLTSSKLRKFLCATNVGLALLFQLLLARLNIDHFLSPARNVFRMFICFNEVNTTMGTIFLLNSIWVYKYKLVKFIERSTSTTGIRQDSHWKHTGFGLATITLHCFGFLQTFIFGARDDEVNPISETIVTTFSEIMGVSGDCFVWLQRISRLVTSYFLTVVMNIVALALASLVLTFRELAFNDFDGNVKQNYGNIPKVLKEYERMKGITEMCKDLFGGVIICFCLCGLTYLAIYPFFILSGVEQQTYGPISYFFVTMYAVIFGTILHLAADVSGKMQQTLQKYISRHQWQDQWSCKERHQLAALSHEVDASPMGISCGFFTITKSVLSSTIGLVVTYALLLFQTK